MLVFRGGVTPGNNFRKSLDSYLIHQGRYERERTEVPSGTDSRSSLDKKFENDIQKLQKQARDYVAIIRDGVVTVGGQILV